MTTLVKGKARRGKEGVEKQNKDIYFLLIFMGFVVSVAVDIVDASYNARLHES